MAKGIQIDELADEIIKELAEYAEAATEDVKEAVKDAAQTVREEIKLKAPRDTGEYAKSWAAKKQKETANTLSMVVHSTNRYQLTHLLEFGHAKRNGGRVAAQPHIAPAEQVGIEQLERDIEQALKG